MAKLANLCWEGLTLKHISDKQIVFPYLLFVFMSMLFELFLSILFIGACIVFYVFGYRPGVSYFVSGAVLVLMLIMTISVLKIVWLKHKSNR